MPVLKKLKSNTDFRRAYGRGKSYTDPALVLYVVRNRAGFSRYGITTSKRIGNAVKRNRARRVISEALRNLDIDFSGSYDIVLVARARTVYKKSTYISTVLMSLFSKAGIIDEKTTS